MNRRLRWRNPWPIEAVVVEGEFTARVEGEQYEFEYEAKLNPGGLEYFPDEVNVRRPAGMPFEVWERNKDEIFEAALGDARRQHEFLVNPSASGVSPGPVSQVYQSKLEWRMEDIRHGQGHYFIVKDDEDALLKAADFADERGHVVIAQPWKPRKGVPIVVIPIALVASGGVLEKSVFRLGRFVPVRLPDDLSDIVNYYHKLGYSVEEPLTEVEVAVTSSEARALGSRPPPVEAPALRLDDDGDGFVSENPARDEQLSPIPIRPMTEEELESEGRHCETCTCPEDRPVPDWAKSKTDAQLEAEDAHCDTCTCNSDKWDFSTAHGLTLVRRGATRSLSSAVPKKNPAYDQSLEPDPRVYRCEKCGDADSLFVVQCTVMGKMPLDDDGFEITGDTDDEIVVCSKCNHTHKGLPFTEEDV